MDSGDPWFWTSDVLVSQLCCSVQLFEDAGYGPPNCPDPKAFETPIRKNEIAGASFLSGLDDQALREDLGIQALGQRQALLAVIRLLRLRSARYRQFNSTAELGNALPTGNSAGSADSVVHSRLGEATVLDSSGRRRRKVTALTTVPLSTPTPAGPSANPGKPISLGEGHGSLDRPAGSWVGGEWDYLLDRYGDSSQDVSNQETSINGRPIPDPNACHGSRPLPTELHHHAPAQLRLEQPESDLHPIVATGKLNSTEVEDVINECIEVFAERWHSFVLPKIEWTAFNMWNNAGSLQKRQELAATKAANIDYFKHRLNRIGDEIMRFPWNQEKELKTQCQSLEVTVHTLEQEKWEQLVYEMSSPPPNLDKPDPALFASERPLQNDVDSNTDTDGDDVDDEEDATSIDVDMEPQNEGERLFIVDDSDPLVNEIQDIIDGTNPSVKKSREIVDLGSGSEDESDLDAMDVDEHQPATMEERPSIPIPSTERVLTTSQTSDLRLGLPLRERHRRYGDRPEDATFAEVSKWDWGILKDTEDRKRIIMKALHGLNEEDRNAIRAKMEVNRQTVLRGEIPACIKMWIRGENKLQGVLPRDMAKIVQFTKLFLCWWFGDNCMECYVTTEQLEELVDCLSKGVHDPETFHDWLHVILERTFKKGTYSEKRFAIPPAAEIIVIDSD